MQRGLDSPLFLLYNGVIMKKNKVVKQMRKVRVLTNKEIYYTDSSWETKEIDGIKFIYVIKSIGIRETPKLMRRDSLEYIV